MLQTKPCSDKGFHSAHAYIVKLETGAMVFNCPGNYEDSLTNVRPSKSPNTTTVENGYPLGRPEDRDEDVLDLIVEEAIDSIPMAARLYPDIYSWSVVDAISKYLKDNGYRLVRDRRWERCGS